MPGLGGDHADGGDCAAEVDVEVVERAAAHPIADEEGLGEIEKSEGATEQVEFAEAEGCAQTAPRDAWMGEGDDEDLERDCEDAGGLDVIGLICLGGLDWRQVVARAVWVVDGGDFDGEAALAEAQHFFQKEGVRDGRVPAEQVSDAQRAGWGRGMGRWERIWQPEFSIGRRKTRGVRRNCAKRKFVLGKSADLGAVSIVSFICLPNIPGAAKGQSPLFPSRRKLGQFAPGCSIFIEK